MARLVVNNNIEKKHVTMRLDYWTMCTKYKHNWEMQN